MKARTKYGYGYGYTGFWKDHKESITLLSGVSGEIILYECSKCGAKFYDTDITKFNFCPNCRNPKKMTDSEEDVDAVQDSIDMLPYPWTEEKYNEIYNKEKEK